MYKIFIENFTRNCRNFYLGLLLFILSYIPIFLPENIINSIDSITLIKPIITYVFFCMGLIIVIESITYKIKKYSLIAHIFENRKHFIQFYILSVLSIILLDLVGASMSKLWYYPGLGLSIRGILNTIFLYLAGSFFCILVIFEIIILFKILITKYFKVSTFSTVDKPIVKPIFLLVSGIVFLILSLIQFTLETIKIGNYDFRYNLSVSNSVSFVFPVLISIAFFLLMEYVAIIKNKHTFLNYNLISNFQLIAAIILATLLISLLMETKNAVKIEQYWVYTNWPFQKYKIFELPASMLFMWIIQDIFFIELFNSIEKDSELKVLFD